MDLFIDTNVWLSFYHFSSDDLEALRKLGVLIERGTVRLLLPDQVIDEFRRNREAKIADALKRFKSDRVPDQFPRMCMEYEEFATLREALSAAKEAKSKLLDRLNTDIAEMNLKADDVIEELFGKADQIDVTSRIIKRAKRRQQRGNPPGKSGSLGDAINWETLLASIQEGEDLYLVAADSDYAAATDGDACSPFLAREWKENVGGEVAFYTRLGPFFKEHFPDVELAEELEKELLIQDLANSSSFRMTRKTLRKLNRYEDFTTREVTDIASAAVSNNQIYWIMEDEDIRRYLEQIVGSREEQIDPELAGLLREYLADAVE